MTEEELERYIRTLEPSKEQLKLEKELFIKWHMERFGSTKEVASEIAEEHLTSEREERQMMREDPYYNPEDYEE